MTAQLAEHFIYGDFSFNTLKFSDKAAFNPEMLNLEPSGSSTACARGYQSTYAVFKGNLVLDSLDINLLEHYLSGKIEGPMINGFKPEIPILDGSFNNRYRNINYPLKYTGGVIIARSFIGDEGPFGMRLREPGLYEHPIELIFKGGKLIQERDLGQEVERMRSLELNDYELRRLFRKVTVQSYSW